MADDELKQMEQYLRKLYSKAGKEVLVKAQNYLRKFENLDKKMKQKVEEGKLSEDEYQKWRKAEILSGEHWDNLLSQITGELYKTNKTASEYVAGKSVKIFSENYNLVKDEIPKNLPVKGYTFELVNEETVRQLATAGELMLPPPNPPDKYKDNKWNAKQVHAEVLQGIIQGNSMDDIAKRLYKTVDKNHSSAIRNARTMVTAAENSGRQAGFDKAEKDGIIFKKEWIATVGDGRTRETHLAINGELVDNEATFSNGCRFPGDWTADPSEVYNCRCTLGSRFVGFVKKSLEEAVEKIKEEQPEKSEELRSYAKEIEELIVDMQKDAINHEGHPEKAIKLGEYVMTDPTLPYHQAQEKLSELKGKCDELTAKIKEINETVSNLTYEEKCELLNQRSQMFKERDKIYQDYEKEYRKALIESIFKVREDSQGGEIVFAKFRKTENLKKAHDALEYAATLYPSAWVDMFNSHMKREGLSSGLSIKFTDRGYYSNAERLIAISAIDISDARTTAIHEMGHAMERAIPGIVEQERAFYDYRTKGEDLVWLGYPYKKSEKTRRDDFEHKYMGKDYGGDFFELVSMGFQYVLGEKFKEDEEMEKWTVGLLCGLGY